MDGNNQYTVGQNGHLFVEGMDAVCLAKDYGTPLYVMSESKLRSNMRRYVTAVREHFGERGLVAYASKALCCKEIIRIARDEQMGLDVVSLGELYTAVSADFPVDRIFFHGNCKSDDELAYAVESGVGRIVVDNEWELSRLGSLLFKKQKTQKILLRLKPGVEAHTHRSVKTGGIDSQFGFAIENGEALRAVEATLACEGIELAGIHSHIGSQILTVEPFLEAARVMAGFIQTVRDQFGVVLPELNLGGGAGIRYRPEDRALPPELLVGRVKEVLADCFAAEKMPLPAVIFEPGRSIVGSAGMTLYTVGAIKTVEGVRTYVIVDGGMTDNPRYALYKAPYEMAVAGRMNAPKDLSVTIAGRCCESGDLLQEDVMLPAPVSGDLLAVFATGAFNYAMASNYNRVQRPAMVMVCGGGSREIIRRETLASLVQNDL